MWKKTTTDVAYSVKKGYVTMKQAAEDRRKWKCSDIEGKRGRLENTRTLKWNTLEYACIFFKNTIRMIRAFYFGGLFSVVI